MIRVERHKVGEVVNEVVNDAHVKVGIDAGELDPITAEDLVIGEGNTNI